VGYLIGLVDLLEHPLKKSAMQKIVSRGKLGLASQILMKHQKYEWRFRDTIDCKERCCTPLLLVACPDSCLDAILRQLSCTCEKGKFFHIIGRKNDTKH
jgi:hypothetical protein